MKLLKLKVSTHSRLKAAGSEQDSGGLLRFGFNTQPPKGGWDRNIHHFKIV